MYPNKRTGFPRETLIAFLAAVLVVPNAGCLDLAIMGAGAVIRQAQYDKQMQRQRGLDAERAARDNRNYEAMRRLEEQNERLERRLSRYENGTKPAGPGNE